MIAVAQALLVGSLALLRFRWALCAFVFFLAFSPRSLGLILSGGDQSLTFPRIAFPLLLLGFVVAALSQLQRDSRGSFALVDSVLILLGVIAASKLASGFANQAPISYAINDMLFTAGVFFLFYAAATEKLLWGVVYAVILAVVVTVPILVLEFVAQRPLFLSLVSKSAAALSEFDADFRAGLYRTRGFFDGPLMLTEFLVLSVGIVCFARSNARGGNRLAYTALLVLIAIGILSTGSRSGVIVGFAAFLAYHLAFRWSRIRPNSRLLLLTGLALLVTLAVAQSFELVTSLAEKAQGVRFSDFDSVERSTMSRALQFVETAEVLRENPVFGVGVRQNFADELDEIHRIDNYYLRVALEAGVTGLVLFLLFLAYLLRRFANISEMAGTREGSLRALAISTLVAFAMMKLFLSQPTNNIFYFGLFACFLKVDKRYRALLARHEYSFG